VSFCHVGHSEFLALTHSISGMIISDKEITKESDVFEMFSSSNLPALLFQ
jgi:hypothetical protein